MSVRLWLDDLRPPWQHGRIGWKWVKTADEAISVLRNGQVVEASLDHDLDIDATMGREPTSPTGASVLRWMIDNDVWPADGVHVHSQNPQGRAVMLRMIALREVKP